MSDGLYPDPHIDGVASSNPSVPLRGIAIDVLGGYVYYVSLDSSGNLRIIRSDLSFGNQAS